MMRRLHNQTRCADSPMCPVVSANSERPTPTRPSSLTALALPDLQSLLTRQLVEVALTEAVVCPLLVEDGAQALQHPPPPGVRGPAVAVGHRRGLRELLGRDLGQPRLHL